MADTPNLPLVVDLDGTLIRTDMMWESLARLLRRNPLAIFAILFWWTRGRARLKQKLAARVQIDPATLPYHERFLAWLRAEKASGRKIILATASDLKMAQPIAAHVGLFDEVLASDGQTNLRSENKLRALTKKFGARGFDYAGNSSADFAVWRGSREAVVVNASHRVLREAANCTKLGATFCEGFSPVAVAKSFCTELFWRSGYLVAIIAGLLLALAFPKFSLAGFAWVAPALLLFAARGKSGADAFRAGYLGGITFWLASLYWLLLMPATGFPILAWVALSAYVAIYFGAWTWLVSSFKFQVSSWGQPRALDNHRRGGVGRAGTFARLAVQRISVEPARRVAIPTRPAHSNRGGNRRLWRVISRRVVFARALFGGGNDLSPPDQTPRLAGRNCFTARHGAVAVCRRHFCNWQQSASGKNFAGRAHSTERPTDFNLVANRR